MSDVRIMKKIIQIYNILQVLWSSKMKFVSLSQLLGCPLFGSNFGFFTVPGFIVSPLLGYGCACTQGLPWFALSSVPVVSHLSCTVPGQCLWCQVRPRISRSLVSDCGLVCVVSFWYLGFGFNTPHTSTRAPGVQVERRLELLLQ